jgi:hypothetical protein
MVITPAIPVKKTPPRIGFRTGAESGGGRKPGGGPKNGLQGGFLHRRGGVAVSTKSRFFRRTN